MNSYQKLQNDYAVSIMRLTETFHMYTFSLLNILFSVIRKTNIGHNTFTTLFNALGPFN